MFKLEAEMKAPVQGWLSDQAMHIAEEFSTGWGICDLVGCKFNPKQVAYRTERKQRQPLGSPQAVFIYNQLPDAAVSRRGVNLRTLADRLAPYVSDHRIEQILLRLVATNHVRATRTGTFQKVNGWAPMQSRLIAIELKLNRLSEVLEQAKANRTFAPESFVALPISVAERALSSSFANELTREGIGLLGVTEESCELLLHASPPADCLDETLELWAVEYFWRIYRGKH